MSEPVFTEKHRRRQTVGGNTGVVPFCYNNSREDKARISFHRFPKDKELRKNWVAFVKRPESWKPGKWSVVCGAHFAGGRCTHNSPVPTIRPVPPRPEGKQERSACSGARRKSKWQELREDAGEHTYGGDDGTSESSLSDEEDLGNGESLLPDYLFPEEEEVEALVEENERLRTSVFSLENISKSDSDFQYYTGLKNVEIFDCIFNNLFKSVAPFMNYRRGRETHAPSHHHKESGKTGPVRNLNPREEMFLVLVRLRRGLHGHDLARRFQVHESTVSRIWDTWLPMMHDRLRNLDIWPTQAYVKETMPRAFLGTDYVNTRVILDCTEMRVEKATSFRCQSSTFSSYKHYNTAKGLVGISPNGAITFVSVLYSGRTTDRAVVYDCGVLKKLENGDAVMADRGFDIEDACKKQNVHLHIPPFMKGEAQLSAADERRSRSVAVLRQLVERAIRRIKVFRILSSTFPLKMAPSLNHIWVICAHLTNFLPPLVSDKSDTPASCIVSTASLLPVSSAALTVATVVSSEDSEDSASESSTTASYKSRRLLEADCTVVLPREADETFMVLTYMPLEYCQSSLDGRNGSNACCVIAACAARRALLGHFDLPDPGSTPSTDLMNMYVECMRDGNMLYDSAQDIHGGNFLSTYDCLEMFDTELALYSVEQHSFSNEAQLAFYLEEIVKFSRREEEEFQFPLQPAILVAPPHRSAPGGRWQIFLRARLSLSPPYGAVFASPVAQFDAVNMVTHLLGILFSMNTEKRYSLVFVDLQ